MDKDRTQGGQNKVVGKVKEMAGKLTGNERLEAEGKAQQVGGTVQGKVGEAKDTVRGTVKR